MSQVAIIMGSKSDFEVMSEAIEILKSFDINTEYDIVSAHRTPNKMVEYAATVALNGSKNAGILAAQIIGSFDSKVADKVKAYKKDLEDKVIESSKDLKKNS